MGGVRDLENLWGTTWVGHCDAAPVWTSSWIEVLDNIYIFGTTQILHL